MKKTLLEIKDLTCGYETKVVLQDINLEVEEKEFIGIIGPNGSGKTTLLRAITGMLKAMKGAVYLEGSDTGKMHPRQLAKIIAVVAQSVEAANITVEEFVLLGRIPHFKCFQFLETKEDLETAEKCMFQTDTFRLKDQFMGRISGGERQLALIARALTQKPKLLLLDEPTAHLDIAHQVGILDLISRLNKEFGLTVLLVLHDLNLASLYCQRLLLLNDGYVYKEGSPQEVLTYPVIEAVYKTVVVVKENPQSLRPYVFLVSEAEKAKANLR